VELFTNSRLPDVGLELREPSIIYDEPPNDNLAEPILSLALVVISRLFFIVIVPASIVAFSSSVTVLFIFKLLYNPAGITCTTSSPVYSTVPYKFNAVGGSHSSYHHPYAPL